MISCTEFIPLYSELFRFLEEKNGYDAVLDYWHFISSQGISDKNNIYSLISFLERDKDNPIEGAWKYWCKSLSEEACDMLRIYDPERKIIADYMRHCPSRGMLNDLQHIEPYHAYCEHCNVIYEPTLNAYGLESRSDHSGICQAQCRSILFEAGKDPGYDLSTLDPKDLIHDGVQVIDMKAEDNKYLHRDFHFHGDLALRYLGEHYGEDTVRSFLTDYANRYYSPVLDDAKVRGLPALKEWIEKVYEIEEASDLITFDLTDTSLTVSIEKSPAIDYLRSTGYEVSKYYIEQTRTLYAAMAKTLGMGFELKAYDADGKAEFVFTV